jgi:hypothetical protein
MSYFNDFLETFVLTFIGLLTNAGYIVGNKTGMFPVTVMNIPNSPLEGVSYVILHFIWHFVFQGPLISFAQGFSLSP